MKHIVRLFATGFYFGCSSVAPGTFGSFFALLFGFIMVELLNPTYLLILNIVILVAGVISSDLYVRIYKKEDSDPGEIVIDEISGLLICLNLCYYFFKDLGFLDYFMAFVFFRIFDISKILGIKYIDRNIKNGIGVMLDDVIAGVYSFLCIYGIHLLMLKLK